jgi:DNA helicase-2/ATP-dependent DNA helicase PcrA
MADSAPTGTTLRDFTAELQQRQEARHEPTLDSVTLSSIHSAKGLEWHSVYLVGLSEGLLPVSFATSPEDVNEERRVFYVAVTRASSRLTMSWASSFGSHGSPRTRSRFLSELDTRSRR